MAELHASTPDRDPAAGAPAPRHVLLLSGHRVDAPGRVPHRFASGSVAKAAVAIAETLDALQAGPEDLALTQGSSGGDLLFAEACVRRGVTLRLMQPHPEPRFVEESVRGSSDGTRWVDRYLAVRAAADGPPRLLPDGAPGEASGDAAADRYERCNRWLLETALAHGPERLRFICLWDGRASDGPGGTAQLVEEVRQRGLPVIWLDARHL